MSARSVTAWLGLIGEHTPGTKPLTPRPLVARLVAEPTHTHTGSDEETTLTTEQAKREALTMAANGAIFYVSHSGGKDSQATYAELRSWGIPDSQIVVVHADLGVAEWPGTIAHIEASIEHTLNVVTGTKTFFGIVEHRMATRPDVAPWPSPKYRDCTATLKRAPIQKFIRRDMKERGALLACNVMGLRAEESAARAKRPAIERNDELSKAGRTVMNLYPVHDWNTAKVKGRVLASGQKLGRAYETGNDRMSCAFCIMGCPSDLANAARQFPELLAQYEELEQRSGYTMFHRKSLREKIAEAAPITHTEQLELL